MSKRCGAATGETLQELLDSIQYGLNNGYVPVGGICYTGKLFVWGMIGEAPPPLIESGKVANRDALATPA